MIDKEKYESTGVCGYEECDDCGEKVCTHAYVDFYWGKMVFEMKCQNGFEWIETWTYKGSDWKLLTIVDSLTTRSGLKSFNC